MMNRRKPRHAGVALAQIGEVRGQPLIPATAFGCACVALVPRYQSNFQPTTVGTPELSQPTSFRVLGCSFPRKDVSPNALGQHLSTCLVARVSGDALSSNKCHSTSLLSADVCGSTAALSTSSSQARSLCWRCRPRASVLPDSLRCTCARQALMSQIFLGLRPTKLILYVRQLGGRSGK